MQFTSIDRKIKLAVAYVFVRLLFDWTGRPTAMVELDCPRALLLLVSRGATKAFISKAVTTQTSILAHPPRLSLQFCIMSLFIRLNRAENLPQLSLIQALL